VVDATRDCEGSPEQDEGEDQKEEQHGSHRMEYAEPEKPRRDQNDRQGEQQMMFLQIKPFACPLLEGVQLPQQVYPKHQSGDIARSTGL